MGVLAKKDAMRAFRAMLGLLLASAASPALADWRAGKVTQLAIGYAGPTITFLLSVLEQAELHVLSLVVDPYVT